MHTAFPVKLLALPASAVGPFTLSKLHDGVSAMRSPEAHPVGGQEKVGLDGDPAAPRAYCFKVWEPHCCCVLREKWTLPSSGCCPEGCVALTATGPISGGHFSQEHVSLACTPCIFLVLT